MSEKENSKEEFKTQNELEFLIQAGRDGKVSIGTVFQCLLRSQVYMVLDQELKDGKVPEGVKSLMVTSKDGQQMLTLFTGEERASHFLDKQPGYKYPVPFPANILLDSPSNDMGLVINPELPVGVQINAEVLQSLKAQLGRGWLKNIPETPQQQGEQAGNA
jgi:hypothetical protein